MRYEDDPDLRTFSRDSDRIELDVVSRPLVQDSLDHVHRFVSGLEATTE